MGNLGHQAARLAASKICDNIVKGLCKDPETEVVKLIDMWQKFAFTFILVSSFVLLYQKECFRKAVSALRFYGKMSLTNYIAQSIMGAIIYFPFGLYLAPYCGYTISLLIGFALFLLQVSFCKWWLASHKQGPLESIWHKWTWMFSNNK